MGPDTHRGGRLIPRHSCAGELSPRQSRGVGACRTPAPPQSGCCTPCCRGSCATVGHQGGKRWQHWVLLGAGQGGSSAPRAACVSCQGGPHGQGATGTHTDGITRVVDEHGLCHVEAELLCETRQAVVKVFQIRFAHGIHVQCYHPGVSHFILPLLHHSSLPILPVP